MADAHGSGPCVRKDVGGQLPPRPQDAPRDPCPGRARTGVASWSPRGGARRARVPGASSGGFASLALARRRCVARLLEVLRGASLSGVLGGASLSVWWAERGASCLLR